MRAATLLSLLLLGGCASTPAAPPSGSPTASAPPPLDVAVTVDDLPIHGPDFGGVDRVAIADRLIATFRAHQLPAVYGFVNGQKLDEHPETVTVLHHWLAAGFPLGNHAYSHMSLNDHDVPAYIADVEQGERVLREMEPHEAAWKVFRFPFLFEGDTLEKYDAVHSYLAARGYVTAEVTIDGDDWAWNPPFARCTDRHDVAALAELRRGYVETHLSELRYIRAVTRELAGHEVKQVLLLHVGAADADAMDDLLTAFEHEGVHWVDLKTALADPFYASDRRLGYKGGAAFPYPVAKARGVKLPPYPERPAEDKLASTCR